MSAWDAQDWLAHAEADLDYAKLGRSAPKTLESLIAFHAQQAMEKSLKAVLVRFQVEFRKTHDLEELAELIADAGLNWPAEFEKVAEFTPFATQSRYPGFDEPVTLAKVDEAIAAAEQVLAWAKRVLDKASGVGA
jgi:HEPN domain-containing protein